MTREGTVIADRYRLVEQLAVHGSPGRTTWLAHDEECRYDVTMTEAALQPSAAGDGPDVAAWVTAVRDEIRLVRRLDEHHRSVAVHDCVAHGRSLWIVSGYVPGAVDLGSRIEFGGGLPPEEVARIGLEVLDVLCAGHFLGVIHQALCPPAVLLVPGGGGETCGTVLVSGYEIGATSRTEPVRLRSSGRARAPPPPPDPLTCDSKPCPHTPNAYDRSFKCGPGQARHAGEPRQYRCRALSVTGG